MEEYNKKYNLGKKSKDIENLIKYLKRAPSKLYEIKSTKYSIDNCECPSCDMCCNPDFPLLWPAGAALLATCTPLLMTMTAAELAE